MASIKIEVRNLQKLIALCREDKLYRQPVKQSLNEIGSRVVQSVRAGAPAGATEQLRAKLTHKVNSGAVPRWIVIKTDATATPARPYTRSQRRTESAIRNRRGRTKYPYSYPKRLEFDPKSRHKDWLKNGVERARGQIESGLKNAAKRIESQWRAA